MDKVVGVTEKTAKVQRVIGRPFVKGQSGNPKGKPPGSGISITTEIKKKLAECPKGSKATYLALLIDQIISQSIKKGDQQMITRIWNYVDGMPKQNNDITSGGKEIKTVLVEFLDGTKQNTDTD